MNHLCKLFSRIVTNRLEAKVDFCKSKEQADFRSGYEKNDYLQCLKTSIDQSNIIGPWPSFSLTFTKHLHSGNSRHFNSIKEKQSGPQILKYNSKHLWKCSKAVKLYSTTEKINIERELRQGDSHDSQILLITAMEYSFKHSECESNGINIDGQKLNHLRFVNDIILISDDLGKLEICYN